MTIWCVVHMHEELLYTNSQDATLTILRVGALGTLAIACRQQRAGVGAIGLQSVAGTTQWLEPTQEHLKGAWNM